MSKDKTTGAAAYRDSKPPVSDMPDVSGKHDPTREATLITPPNGKPTVGGYQGYSR